MAIEQQNLHAIRNSFFYKLILCCIITLVVMYAHRLLPAKILDVVPGVDVKTYIYGDTDSVGKDVFSWTDLQKLAWQCNIVDDGEQHNCGFNVDVGAGINTEGMDLSSYDKVNIELDYNGPDNRLRFYTRNYAEGFSKIDDIGTAKYISTLIPTKFLSETLTIQFSEFSVAEWWISEYHVPREFMHPDFNNTIVFGIDVAHPTVPGIHRFKLKKIQFVGRWISAELWYLGILVFWMLVIFVGGVYNFLQLKRQSKLERLRLEVLVSQNSALEHETNRYKQLSMLDQLTGMLNRHGFSEYLEKNYNESSQEVASLIIIDIDYFKRINDAHGHDSGDIVLHKVADIIRQNIRSQDIAARWGGEEFVVLLPDTEAEKARVVAEELRTQVANASFEVPPLSQVTISAGVGMIIGAEPFHMLFRRVDIALYQAKAQGRNRVIMAAN